MNARKNSLLLIIAGIVIAAVAMYFRPAPLQAQPAGGADVTAVLGQAISTKVVTIKLENQRGEPRMLSTRAKFDRPVQAYWVSLVGYDLKFTGNTGKYLQRQMVSGDAFAKVIDGTELEVSGKMGLRDGSGDWDDMYEGTITVAVTAVLSR